MLTRLIEDIRTEKLTTRPRDLARKARTRLVTARGEGVERLWHLQTEALERAEALLGKAPESVPVLSRVADAAERIVHQRLETVTAISVDGYDDLTAKEVRLRLRELGHVGLLNLRRYEAGNKNRKSVLTEIDREIRRRVQPPVDETVADVAPVADDAAQSA